MTPRIVVCILDPIPLSEMEELAAKLTPLLGADAVASPAVAESLGVRFAFCTPKTVAHEGWQACALRNYRLDYCDGSRGAIEGILGRVFTDAEWRIVAAAQKRGILHTSEILRNNSIIEDVMP